MALEPGGIITWIVVGLIAGWLTGKVMKGRGYGGFRDIVLGIVGAFIGGVVISLFGVHGQQPNVRDGLQQLLLTKQNDRLSTDIATLDGTLKANAAAADRLNTRMLYLTGVTALLSVIMAVAAGMQIGQAVGCGRRSSTTTMSTTTTTSTSTTVTTSSTTASTTPSSRPVR